MQFTILAIKSESRKDYSNWHKINITLLVGMQASATTLENNVEAS
jgi:hypothetical protein